MLVFVGLGNPTNEYAHTYHNIGFDVVDALSREFNIPISQKKFKGLVGQGFVGEEKVLLVKPQTYMNNSGECVAEVKRKFADARIVVIVDDIDLPKGNIRYREHGSAGTHNGLRSIVSFVGQEFERIKVGIGRDVTMDLADYVLSKYDEKEFQPIIEKAVEEIKERFF